MNQDVPRRRWPVTSAPVQLIGQAQQLSEQVADFVREKVIAGEVPASAFLRTEHLASEMGVSATPVREALMILQSEGTLRWEQRRGFRVVPMSREDIEDIFLVQAFASGELAARAATAMPRAEIDRLRKVQLELEQAAEAGDAAAVDGLNQEIHRAIHRAPDAQRMTSILNMTMRYVPLHYFGNVEGWADSAAHDHGPILDALEARDPAAARTAMSEHVRKIGDLLIAHLVGQGVLEGTTPN